jgi:hypothetical protein
MADQMYFTLRREVSNLAQVQLQALGQQSTSSQKHDCRARFERIMELQQEVARLRRESIMGGSKRLLVK